MPRYRAYGLTLESSLPLPGLRRAPGGPTDVLLESADPGRFEAARRSLYPDRPTEWFCARRLEDRTIYLRWAKAFEFLVSADGARIDYRRERQATVDSFAVYMLGQVLSFSLLARGVEALHATVVVVNGRAAAFVGDCGHGKSTLAAAMLARGFRLLTDDLMVIRPGVGAWRVEPGVPRIKLFPSVARRVLGVKGVGPRMNDGTSKLVLPLASSSAARTPVPLAAMYVLAAPAHRRRPTDPTVTSLSRADAFIEVVRAAFNLTVTDRGRLANQFGFAAQVAATVPLRRLSYARRLTALPYVCDAVLADLAAPPASAMKA